MTTVIYLANLDNIRLFGDENSCSNASSSIVVRFYVKFCIQSEVCIINM